MQQQQSAATSTAATSTSASGLQVPNQDTLVEETGSQPGDGGVDPGVEWGPRGNIIFENVYESLMAYDGPHVDKWVPWLADHYTVSSDGLVYTFYLRKGIMFQDGTPFNASAVKFSIDRNILMNAPNSPDYLIAYTATMAIKGGPRYVNAETTSNYNSTEAKIYLAQEGVKVIDDYTVQITLEHPYAAAIATMAFSVTAVVSPSYVIANCPGSPEMPGVMPGETCQFMLTHAMGTGPFQLTEFTRNVRTVLDRFDGYWGGPNGTGPAKLRRYIINFVPEIGTRELDLYAGTTDGIEIHGTNAFDIIDKNAWLSNRTIVPLKPGIRVWSAPTIAVSYIMLNSRVKPFDDPNFRLALAYAFPYDTYFNSVLNGFAVPLGGRLIPNGMFGSDPSLPSFTYNPDKARALLQQVNYKGNVTLLVVSGQTNELSGSLLLKDSLESLDPNISVVIKEVDFATWETMFEQSTAPDRFGAWTMDISDPAPYVGNFVTPGGQVAIFTEADNNQTIVDLANQAAASTNTTFRLAAYREIQLELLRNAQFVMINSPVALFAERDWVLPGDSAIGRALYNAESGDGDGGVSGGYHAYYISKAQTTQQINVDIGMPFTLSQLQLLTITKSSTRLVNKNYYN